MKKDQSGPSGTQTSKGGHALPIVNPHAAGIDVGDTRYDVAFVNVEGVYEQHVFGTFTDELDALVGLLKSNGIQTVAMEATGVYFVALYLALEAAGIDPVLVNARHVKNVTGRKADDSDAAWIQKLHACGLLSKSFQPEGAQRVLREFVRHRSQLVRSNADAARRMQKALEQMNVKVHTVISDILGKSGIAIIEAILAGERDPQALAALCDRRIKAPAEEIRKSLRGIWREDQIFLLAQAHDDYKFRLAQVGECDQMIAAQLLQMVASARGGDLTPLQDIAEQKKSHARTSSPP